MTSTKRSAFVAASFLTTLLLFAGAPLRAADFSESLGAQDWTLGLTPSSALKASGADVPAVSQAVPAMIAAPHGAGKALNAYFISVGQGDAEYIELPNGKTALIDGGPGNGYEPGNQPKDGTPVDPYAGGDPPIAAFITQHGITHIDYVVMTHPHRDHSTGLKYVFDHVKVEHFYDTRESNPNAPEIKTMRAQVTRKGIAVTHPAAGERLSWDPAVKVKVLNSCDKPGSSVTGSVLNDCSIVLKVSYDNQSILYTGDIQEDVETELVAKYGDELHADVLKVGHHGSTNANDQAFLDKVKPSVAFIEVGPNSFGHPTKETLSRLTKEGAKIVRTDKDGTQEYTIGGQAQLVAEK